MEYMGDTTFWDKKFAVRGETLIAPESKLEENLHLLTKGKVLDLACGDGRNTMYCLENGFEVTGVDFSIEALQRLRKFANNKGYDVETKQVDLSVNDPFVDMGVFNNIIVNHYRLGKEQIKALMSHIAPGGILFVNGFGHDHSVDDRIREQDLIIKSDFQELEDHFTLVKYEEYSDSRGFFVTYIYQKNS